MTRPRSATTALAAAVLGASLLAGCATADRALPTAYRSRYLADVAPVNATLATLARRYGNQDALSAAEAAPLVVAYRRLQTELRHQAWPPAARRDVRALATIAGWVIGDLDRGVSPDGVARLAADQHQVRATSATVRADLGLPAPTGATPTAPAAVPE